MLELHSIWWCGANGVRVSAIERPIHNVYTIEIYQPYFVEREVNHDSHATIIMFGTGLYI